MNLRMFQVDAFAERPFEGNPAAVVPLQTWLADEVMQAIAMENNLAETAFIVAEADGFALRWFTPTVEVPLCGHATLASSHVIFSHLGWSRDEIIFQTKSGLLKVRRIKDDLLEMDFPSRPGAERATPAELTQALGAAPDYSIDGELPLAVFATPDQIASLTPDLRKLAAFNSARGDGGVCCTAPAPDGSGWDFVSRFFAPAHGIDEDPVTGGAHCALTPYWSKRLGRTRLTGRQISARGGTVLCEDRGDRVGLSGRCADYLVGEITI